VPAEPACFAASTLCRCTFQGARCHIAPCQGQSVESCSVHMQAGHAGHARDCCFDASVCETRMCSTPERLWDVDAKLKTCECAFAHSCTHTDRSGRLCSVLACMLVLLTQHTLYAEVSHRPFACMHGLGTLANIAGWFCEDLLSMARKCMPCRTQQLRTFAQHV
jgi:hypothetical protein